MGFSRLNWADQKRLGHPDQPLYLVAFFNDRRYDTGSVQYGKTTHWMFGLSQTNAHADHWGIEAGRKVLRFEDSESIGSGTHRDVARDHWLMRLEYGRSTARNKVDAFRPAFRYGASVLVRDGTSSSHVENPSGPNKVDLMKAGDATAVTLQTFIWWGYRSPRLLGGMQLNLNILAHAFGSLHTDDFRHSFTPYGEVITHDVHTERFSDWLAMDALVRHGLFWSDMQVKLTYHFLPLPKRAGRSPTDVE